MVSLVKSTPRFGSARKSGDVQLVPPAVKLPGKIKPPKIELPRIEQDSLNRLDGGALSSDAVIAQLIDTEWAYPLPDKVALARYQESIVKHSTVPTPLVDNLLLDPVIKSLTLGQQSVGVYSGEPGSGGIWILLEPRNAVNQVVRPTGELSVAVLNPKAYSEKQGADRQLEIFPGADGGDYQGHAPWRGFAFGTSLVKQTAGTKSNAALSAAHHARWRSSGGRSSHRCFSKVVRSGFR